MEDLSRTGNLGPREAAEVCDFLTMHGYPGYATWADGPTDERLLPFLAQITRWLGGGAEVLFSEFGVPTTCARARRAACRRRARARDEQAPPPTSAARSRRYSSAAAPARCSGATRITRRPFGGVRPSTSRSTSDRSATGAPTARRSRRSPWSRPSRSERSAAGSGHRGLEWIDIER